jgi:hypothetical protein
MITVGFNLLYNLVVLQHNSLVHDYVLKTVAPSKIFVF